LFIGSASSGTRACGSRPTERVRIGHAYGAVDNFAGTIEFVSYLGVNTEYVVRLASGDAVMVEVHNDRGESAEALTVGSKTTVAWDPEACRLIT